jgi:hypothetical protein
MGSENIRGLKKAFGLDETNSTEITDRFMGLIDFVFIEQKVYVEHFDEDKDEMVWSFEDGDIVRLKTKDVIEFVGMIMGTHGEDGNFDFLGDFFNTD